MARELEEDIKQKPYFEAAPTPSPVKEEGTRELGELYPFLISGGTNTERYYFTHINDSTEYKFNIRPRYFGDESNYTEVFPRRINEILKLNNEAQIFCVFDWDTIYADEAKLKKHKEFEKLFQVELSKGTITLWPSMPSIEYWFLLHFENHTTLLKDYSAVSNRLAPYMKNCFSDPSKGFKQLIKKEKYLKDSIWVKNLCADGKLAEAIKRAEVNIKKAIETGELEKQSYSYVYKVFKKTPQQ